MVAGNLIAAKLNAVPPLPEGLVQANGRIEGDHVIVSSKFPGRISELRVREGDTVKAGQLLMKIGDPQTLAKRDQAAASLASAIAEAQGSASSEELTRQSGDAAIIQARGVVAQMESAIQGARSDSLRAQSAVESARAAAEISRQNVSVAQSALVSARAGLDRANASLRGAKAALSAAKAAVGTANSGVDSAKSASDLAIVIAKRYNLLASQGAVSQETAQKAQAQADQSAAQLVAAQHQVVAAQASVDARVTDVDAAEQGVQVSKSAVDQAEAQVKVSKQQSLAAEAAVKQALAQSSSAKEDVVQSEARKSQAEGQLKQAMTASTQVQVSSKSRAAAEQRIKLARAALQEIDSMIGELDVKASTAGTVITRFQDRGEMVSAGSPVLELVDLDKLYLKVYVPENMIGKIHLGLAARIYTDAYPNEPFPAKIGYIASEAEFTPKEIQTATERVSLMYAVRLYLESNPGHRLTPGLPADAIIRWRDDVAWQKPR